VLGGYDGSYEKDVWCSTDGASWTLVTDSADWSGRWEHASVAFDNKLWVMCGGQFETFDGGVWCSSDGVSWTRTAYHIEFERQGCAAVVFDDKMWIMGGWWLDPLQNPILCGDVWSSPDGVVWTEVVHNAAWAPRDRLAACVYDGKMWVVGGNTHSGVAADVWYSTDGATWTLATDSAAWSGRHGHALVALDGRMWVLGGSPGMKNDVWNSIDGVTWTLVQDSAPWPGRWRHPAVVFDGAMWVLGGYSTQGYEHDAWYSNGLAVEGPQPQTSSRKLEPTVLSGSGVGRLASSVAFDAMGRRVVNPRSGVLFVQERSAVSGEPSAVTKVVITR
jgi:hypothetical protein